jgi:hypothetical protein
VVDDVHTVGGAAQRIRVQQIPADHLNPSQPRPHSPGRRVRVRTLGADERADVIATRGQSSREVTAGEAGGAGN